MDKLTPQLNDQQIRENIDALLKGGQSKEQVQSYVDNYKKSADGTYALKNAPATTTTTQPHDRSEGNTMINLGIGAAKGLGNTLLGAGELTSKVLGKVLPGKTGEFFAGGAGEAEHIKNDTNIVKPQGAAQTIGKTAEQIGEFFVPAGEVAKVEGLLSGGAKALTHANLAPIVGDTAAKILEHAASLGTKMAVRATEGGGVIGLQSGGDPEATKTGALAGGLLAPVGEALSTVAKRAGGISEVGKRLAGALSGRGTAVIDEVIKDPKAAMEGLTGESIDTLSKNAKLLKEASVNMKAEAGKEYSRVLNNLQSIYENEGKSFDKGTEINKITDLLKDKFGIIKAGDRAEITGEEVPDKGKLDFESSRFLPKEATIIERALNIIKSFKDPLNPKTIEGLASKIDKLKSQSPSAIETNSVIHTITSSLRESVAKMGEEAGYKEGADLARNFATAMDKIDNFNSLFRTTSEDLRPEGTKGTEEISKVGNLRKGSDAPIILPETEKTKIIQDLSTLFSGNKDVDKDLLKKAVFGGQEVLSREAGRTLATATEKASTKLGDLIREAVITPLLPPKKIGEIVAKTTLNAKQVSKFIKALKALDPVARGSVIELISKNND